MAMAQTKLKVNKVIRFIKDKKVQKLLQVIFVLIIVFNFSSTIWQHKDSYFKFDYWQNFPALEKVYLSSQYVNKHPTGWVPDEVVGLYAGGKLIMGTNPILIIPDSPPLGKYLVGLSALVFNNGNIPILIAGILSLIFMYLVGMQVLKSKILALLPVFFLSFEPIFKNQFVYVPLLDIFQLVFLLAGFYFFNRFLRLRNNYIDILLSMVFLGFFISTKFFITGLVNLAAYYLVLILNKDIKRIFRLTIISPLSILILLLTYIRVFAFGYNLHNFLGIQKWIFLYHKSQLILPLSIWPLLLLNKWYVWFGNKPVLFDPQWLVTWPIVTILSLVTVLAYLLNKIPKNKSIEVLMAWVVIYLLFFSFGEISSRYFVILIPILYIVSFFGVTEFTKKIIYNKKPHV